MFICVIIYNVYKYIYDSRVLVSKQEEINILKNREQGVFYTIFSAI